MRLLKAQNNHDPLLILRAAACLMVLFGHGFLIFFRPPLKQMILEHKPIWLLTASPWAGVWIFFTLSGYLIGKGFYSGRYNMNLSDVGRYLTNRALRIMPPYYVGLLLVSAITTPQIFKKENAWILWDILIFNYQGDLPLNPIGALWSISTEVKFYIIAPVLFLLLRQTKRLPKNYAPLITIFVALTGEAYRIIKGTPLVFGYELYHEIYSPLLANLDVFVIGLSLNLVIPSLRNSAIAKQCNGRLAILVFALLYAGISFVSVYSSIFGLKYLWIFCPAPTALMTGVIIIIIELSEKKGNINNSMARILQSMGMLSYCIYIVHSNIFECIKDNFPAPSSLGDQVILFLIGAMATISVSYIFYIAIERPFDLIRQAHNNLHVKKH